MNTRGNSAHMPVETFAIASPWGSPGQGGFHLHAPDVPQPAPPMEVPPQAPPEMPTELPPDIKEPPVPDEERPPAGDPPRDPKPTVMRH